MVHVFLAHRTHCECCGPEHSNNNPFRSSSSCCYVGTAPRAQLLKDSAWLLYLIGKRPHLLHAIVVRLYVRKINVVILTPETVAQLVFEQ